MTPHTLSDAEFTALARGHGDHAAVARLRSARYSKRLVLLRALHDAAHERGLAEHFLPGYTLLADIQRTSPAAVRTALLLPQVGSWAAHTLRRLHGGGRARGPLWADVAHVGAVAVSAVVHARVGCEITVPVRRGAVALPGLGLATLPGAAATAPVRVADG